MFTKHFANFVCEDDTITCEVDGFDCTATLYRDDDYTPPDKRQDGFWPSLDPKNDGYIGAKSKRTLERQRATCKEILRAWYADEWHYFGVDVTVRKNGVQLVDQYEHALWGIEGNWPVVRKGGNPNTYFRDVANDLLPDALATAKAKIESLCDCKQEVA